MKTLLKLFPCFILLCFLTGSSAASLLDLTWNYLGGPPGGLGYDIRYNFADFSRWYVTDSHAGIFISFDRGLTWKSSNNGIMPGPTGWLTVFSLTADPLSPNIIWLGTQFTGDIYKSIDGGLSWNKMDNGITHDDDALSFRGFTISPISSDIVYAMAETSDYELGGSVWGDGVGGEVWKTEDGGLSWTNIWQGPIYSSLARYLWVNPTNPDELFVSTGIFDRGAVGEGDEETDPDPFGGLGILHSMDGGATWEIFDEDNGLENLNIGSLYMHPDDSDVLLAAAGKLIPILAEQKINLDQHSPMGVFRTSDGGQTWTKVIEPSGKLLLEVFTAVEMCPSNPNIAYAAGAFAVYRSTDAGLTWEVRDGEEGEGWGPAGINQGYPIDLQCDPDDPNRILANNYNGGNFLSVDGGRTWVDNSKGYSGAQNSGVAVDPANPGRVYAAARSGPWRSDNAGNTWHGLFEFHPVGGFMFPEMFAIAIDPSSSGRILASDGAGGMYSSEDMGASWYYRQLLPEAGIRIAFAPSNPAFVYAATCPSLCFMDHSECNTGYGVAYSTDGGVSWDLSADSDVNGIPFYDISVNYMDEQVVFAAGLDGLFRSTNGGVEWDHVTSIGVDGAVRAVEVRPNDPDFVIAAVEGVGPYITEDGGINWHPSYSGIQPNGSFHDIVFDPTNPDIIYLSDNRSGVYRSLNNGEQWEQINIELTMLSVLGLAISADGQHLYVGSNGAGVFRLDLNGIPPEPVYFYNFMPMIRH